METNDDSRWDAYDSRASTSSVSISNHSSGHNSKPLTLDLLEAFCVQLADSIMFLAQRHQAAVQRIRDLQLITIQMKLAIGPFIR